MWLKNTNAWAKNKSLLFFCSMVRIVFLLEPGRSVSQINRLWRSCATNFSNDPLLKTILGVTKLYKVLFTSKFCSVIERLQYTTCFLVMSGRFFTPLHFALFRVCTNLSRLFRTRFCSGSGTENIIMRCVLESPVWISSSVGQQHGS